MQKSERLKEVANIELIGIPHRLVLGERGLDDAKIEYIALDDIVEFLKAKKNLD